MQKLFVGAPQALCMELKQRLRFRLKLRLAAPTATGFINFYLAVIGSSTGYECGLSTYKSKADEDKWHWFWNTGSANDGGSYNIAGSAAVPVELSINASKTLNFKVNGTVVKTFVGATGTFSSLTSARLIIAACDQDFGSNVPSPLPNWNTLHYQVTCSNIQYRNSSGTWVTISGSPDPTEFWPTPSASHPHTGTPADYTRSVSTGKIIASLKR